MAAETTAAGLALREAEAVADLMFALSAPSRVRLLSELRQRPRTVGELTAAVEMEQSAVSHQLRVLREHRLVAAKRKGRQRVYELYDEHVASLFDEALSHVESASRQQSKAGRAARRLRRRSP